MAWTYSGDPTTSPKDEVRFLIGDADTTDQQLQDAEINYNIRLVYGDHPPASGNFLPAAYCCDAIAAKYTRAAERKSVGDLSISFSQRVQQYLDLAAMLRRRASLAGVKVYLGGESMAEKVAVNAEVDRTQPAFKVDGMNYASPVNNQNDTEPVGP